MNGLIRICLILSYLRVIPAEHFRSHHDLQKLLHTDQRVVETLENFIQLEKKRVSELENLFKEYKELYTTGIQDRDLINPINVFLLIRRLAISVHEITSRILERGADNIEAVEYAMHQIKKESSFPAYDDFLGAMDGIIRLHDTYELSASDIARGQLTNIEFDVQLSASDCVALGKQAADTYYFDLAIEWMTEALSRLGENDKSNNTNRDPASQNLPFIYEILSHSYEVEGDVRKAFEWNNKLLDLDPNHKRASDKKAILEEMVKDTVEEEVKPRRVRSYKRKYEYDPYRKACRGELSPSDSILSQLKCSYVSPSPFTRLARLKQEEAYLSPRVLIYRDVLNDDEIEVLKELSHPEFLHTVKEDYRVAKWSWLYDENHEVIRRMTLRVEDMTGYTMKTAEQFTVINYGIGGHYEPHLDFFDGTRDNGFGNGDRIATALFYMSDVWRGGGTAFHLLNLTVWPEKGSALVWWNLHTDGSGNYLTQHASCPVLVGSKWVANKWIHEHGQELHNPCRLDETEIQTENRLF